MTQRGIRARTLPELLATARGLPPTDPRRRQALTSRSHKKIAIPLACVAFAFVGVPLAQSLRRGGRGSGFALSLADPRRVLRPPLERRDLGRRRARCRPASPCGSPTWRSWPSESARRSAGGAPRPGASPPARRGRRRLARTRPPHAHGARARARRAAARPLRSSTVTCSARFLSALGLVLASARPDLRGRRLRRQARRGRPAPPFGRRGARLLPLLPGLDHDPDRAVRRAARDASPVSASCRRTTRTRRSAPRACP